MFMITQFKIFESSNIIIKKDKRRYSDFIESHIGCDGKKGRVGTCFLNARQEYFKRKENGENVKYVEGLVYRALEYGTMKWIEHAWILIDDQPYDPTYGENDYEYKEGRIIKDELMTLIPKWMIKSLSKYSIDEDEYKKINISVKNQMRYF